MYHSVKLHVVQHVKPILDLPQGLDPHVSIGKALHHRSSFVPSSPQKYSNSHKHLCTTASQLPLITLPPDPLFNPGSARNFRGLSSIRGHPLPPISQYLPHSSLCPASVPPHQVEVPTFKPIKLIPKHLTTRIQIYILNAIHYSRSNVSLPPHSIPPFTNPQHVFHLEFHANINIPMFANTSQSIHRPCALRMLHLRKRTLDPGRKTCELPDVWA